MVGYTYSGCRTQPQLGPRDCLLGLAQEPEEVLGCAHELRGQHGQSTPHPRAG
jgi:hypothetical protein